MEQRSYLGIITPKGCYVLDVKIPYTRLDIISVQFKITAVAYADSLKETQSQEIHNIYPGKSLRGRKTNQNFL